MKEKLPECCNVKKKKGIKAGILSGIIPHAGCIAIILFALLGVTAANSFFIKFLSNRYYIYIVFGISFVIASTAAFFYVRRFPDKRIRSHWRYLSVLFSSVILINLIMIYAVFPYAANLSGKAVSEGSVMKLDFELPCSAHASLVVSELEKIEGINSVKYISGNSFEVYYNSDIISKEQILNQEICREFSAKEK